MAIEVMSKYFVMQSCRAYFFNCGWDGGLKRDGKEENSNTLLLGVPKGFILSPLIFTIQE